MITLPTLRCRLIYNHHRGINHSNLNFVAILTTALSEIDLNYPNVRNLVAAILRPLEHL